MHEHRVGDAERADYVAALQARRDDARALQANFWVFEHGVERGRFVEFTEAADERVLAAAHADLAPSALWREVETS